MMRAQVVSGLVIVSTTDMSYCDISTHYMRRILYEFGYVSSYYRCNIYGD